MIEQKRLTPNDSAPFPRHENLEDVERLNMLYVGGKDHLGRPVVVFVAKHLPPADEVKLANMERVLLYIIREMDPIVQNDFVLVYVHTDFSEAKRPEFTWLKKVYNLFNRKYKKNMKKIFIVHPTMWTKIIAWLATPFVSSKVWKKLVCKCRSKRDGEKQPRASCSLPP